MVELREKLIDYIKIIDQYQIPYISITLSYDPITNKKIAKHPFGWRDITFDKRQFDPNKNAIIQIMGNINGNSTTPNKSGKNNGVVVIDIDGIEHITNKKIMDICLKYCKFYNKTRKGYHFFFKWNPNLPSAFNIKYKDDPTNSGIDFKTTGGCLYYGSYKINDTIITYDNIIHEDIIDMPTIIIQELNKISGKSTQTSQRKTSNYPNIILNTTHEFPDNTTVIDHNTLDDILKCFPPETYTTYDNWIRICYLIKQTNHLPQAFELFYKYSRSVSQYANVSRNECLAKWNSIKWNPDFNFQILLHLARRNNPKIFNTIALPHINQDIKPLFTPITINTPFINYTDILPYINTNNKIIVIKSPYCTGKHIFYPIISHHKKHLHCLLHHEFHYHIPF